MNTLAVGWDVHRRFSQVSLQELRADGELRIVERKRVEHADRAAMAAWLGQRTMGRCERCVCMPVAARRHAAPRQFGDGR